MMLVFCQRSALHSDFKFFILLSNKGVLAQYCMASALSLNNTRGECSCGSSWVYFGALHGAESSHEIQSVLAWKIQYFQKPLEVKLPRKM